MPPQTADATRLARFLVSAKRACDAARGDDASVPRLLSGSRQLEYGDDRWFYRDGCFGARFFVGQEVVHHVGRPSGSMAYAGGLTGRRSSGVEERNAYWLLRAALRRVDETRPFRGPVLFPNDRLVYRCEVVGSLSRFRGSETIAVASREVLADLRGRLDPVT